MFTKQYNEMMRQADVIEQRNHLESLIRRLKRLGIKLEMFGNAPWIYLDSVNGVKVTDKLHSEHKFTIAFRSNGTELTDIKEIFRVIRKCINKTKSGSYEDLEKLGRGRSKH